LSRLGAMSARAPFGRIGLAVLDPAAAAPAQLARADEPPGPKPLVSSTHTFGKTDFEACVKPNENVPGGPIYDVEFVGPWVPGANQAKGDFKGPKGWEFESIPTGGWRAFSNTPMDNGKEYCFKFPWARSSTIKAGEPDPLPNAINLTATNKNHNAIYNFLSTFKLAEAKEAGVKKRFTLGSETDPGNIFFRRADGSGSGFEEQVGFRGTGIGAFTVTPTPPGQPASGQLFSNGTFAVGNQREGWIGGIQEDRVLLSYSVVPGGAAAGSTRAAAVPPSGAFIGQGTLTRAGRLVRQAACGRPTVIAPSSVRVRSGVGVLRVALACGGDFLPGRRIDVSLKRGRTVQRVGSFLTKTRRVKLTLRNLLRGGGFNSVLLRSRAGDVFKASKTRTVPLKY
jgi:hypothetical protein